MFVTCSRQSYRWNRRKRGGVGCGSVVVLSRRERESSRPPNKKIMTKHTAPKHTHTHTPAHTHTPTHTHTHTQTSRARERDRESPSHPPTISLALPSSWLQTLIM